VNVSQRPCEENLIEKVVRIWVVQLVWDRYMSSNPYTFAIYLKTIPALGIKFEIFNEC
jgi:hypothetical protein